MNRGRIILKLAMAGNIVYFLWIIFNAIDSGFKASPIELVASIGLLILLVLNTVLLAPKK